MTFVYATGDRTIPYPTTQRQIADSRQIHFTSGVMDSLQQVRNLEPSRIEVDIARRTLVDNIHSLGSQGILHGEVHYGLTLVRGNNIPDLDNLLAYNLNVNTEGRYDRELKRGAVFEKMPHPVKAGALAEYLFYRSDLSTFQHYMVGDPILCVEVEPSGNDQQIKEQIADTVSRERREIWGCQLTISVWVTPEKISSRYLKDVVDGVMIGLLGNRSTESTEITNASGSPSNRSTRRRFNPHDSLDTLVAIRILPGDERTRIAVSPVREVIHLHREIGQDTCVNVTRC